MPVRLATSRKTHYGSLMNQAVSVSSLAPIGVRVLCQITHAQIVQDTECSSKFVSRQCQASSPSMALIGRMFTWQVALRRDFMIFRVLCPECLWTEDRFGTLPLLYFIQRGPSVVTVNHRHTSKANTTSRCSFSE